MHIYIYIYIYIYILSLHAMAANKPHFTLDRKAC